MDKMTAPAMNTRLTDALEARLIVLVNDKNMALDQRLAYITGELVEHARSLEARVGRMEADLQKAIDDEPELPGDMSDEMWEAIRNDRDAVAQALRIAVRQTKDGIRKRFAALSAVAKGVEK